MFEFFIAMVCGISLGLIIYTTILCVGCFVLFTNSKFVSWMINMITTRCYKLSEELRKITEETEE